MALSHGKVTVVKLDDLAGALQDVSAFFKSAKASSKTDRPETQAFGHRGKRHDVVGLREFSLALNGYVQPTTTAKVHGKSTKILFDEFALTGYLNKGSVKRSVDLPDTQSFSDLWKRHQVPGLHGGDVSFSGRFDSAAGANDAAFRAALAQDPPGVILDIGLNGFAIGSLVEMCQSVEGDYSIDGNEESPVDVSASFTADEQIELGVSLHDLTAETAIGNYTGVDETAATADGGVGHLHVTAFVGTTATVKIQHSTDNSIFTDLISFVAVTAVGKQRIELAPGTAVNRYVRAQIASGTLTSMTFAVTFGRRTSTYGSPGTHRHFCGLLGLAATSTLQYGPEGGTTGKRRQTGEVRCGDYAVEFDENGVSTWSLTLINDGAITEDVF